MPIICVRGERRTAAAGPGAVRDSWPPDKPLKKAQVGARRDVPDPAPAAKSGPQTSSGPLRE